MACNDPYPPIPIVVKSKGTVHALRHLPWIRCSREFFLRHAAFYMGEWTPERSEMALYHFAIRKGWSYIDSVVLWKFAKEFF